MTRTVTLVVVDPAGSPLGTLPSFEVAPPEWQEVASVTDGARERFGLEVTVLRLVAAGRRQPPRHGAVTYLAQAERIPPRYAGPVDADLSSHPLRAAYARPGGPDATLAWAAAALGTSIGRATLLRTSSNSAIWLLETGAGPVWLKQVPPLFAQEPVVLRYAAARHISVPRLLAADTASDGSRMLLAHVDGTDLDGCPLAERLAIAGDIHELQRAADAVDLVRLGLPDHRTEQVTSLVRALVGRQARVAPTVAGLAAALPDRLAAVDACGLPDTLLHGDLHPGNVRANGAGRTILDWGGGSVGHPAFDVLRLADGLSTAEEAILFNTWAAHWRRAAPGSDPAASIALLRPVYALYGAVVYDQFLANTEPSEHPYYAFGFAQCLTAARLHAEGRIG